MKTIRVLISISLALIIFFMIFLSIGYAFAENPPKYEISVVLLITALILNYLLTKVRIKEGASYIGSLFIVPKTIIEITLIIIGIKTIENLLNK